MSVGVRHLQVVKSGARYKWFGKGGAKKTAMDTTTGKAPRFYPADDIPVPRKSARTVQKVSTILCNPRIPHAYRDPQAESIYYLAIIM